MADKTLESLVPPLDLCYRLYPQDFSDSIYVWAIGPNGNRILVQRNYPVLLNNEQVVLHYEGIAAPTLDEILAALADCGKKATAECITDSQGRHVFSAGYYADTYYRIDRTPAAAALRVWFDVKGRRDA